MSNPESKRFQALEELPRHHCIFMSGTPMRTELKVSDIISQFCRRAVCNCSLMCTHKSPVQHFQDVWAGLSLTCPEEFGNYWYRFMLMYMIAISGSKLHIRMLSLVVASVMRPWRSGGVVWWQNRYVLIMMLTLHCLLHASSPRRSRL